MPRRKAVADISWQNTDVLSKAIPDTLPKWEEWWLHTLHESIRREFGYIESNAQVPEEDLEEAKRTLAGWRKTAPMLDLQHTLRLIDDELARRWTWPSGPTSKQ